MNYYLDVFRNYASFDGRARRKEYWMFTLIHIIVLYVLLALGIFVSGIFLILYFVYALASFLPTLGVTIRRMHDTGKSGWYMLIPIYSLILACTEGDTGTNEYGADPKGFGEEITEIGTSQE